MYHPATDREGELLDRTATRGRLGNRTPLPTRLADDLRKRLELKQWVAGDQLPTEAALCQEYGVSRATVRQALKTLESRGLIHTVQGRGSFVSDDTMIRAGMQDLTSITSTIREMGMVPDMIYHHRTLRPATLAEAERFDLPLGTEVLDVQRKILADGITVCYSYDVLPRWVFPDDFAVESLQGSIFGYLQSHHGPRPVRASAEVHAVVNPDVAWDESFADDQLFVLLDQLHVDEDARPFMHTRSYFIEGRFNFTVIRIAPVA